MARTITLKFTRIGNGISHSGFNVTLRSDDREVQARLSPLPEQLQRALHDWRESYVALLDSGSSLIPTPITSSGSSDTVRRNLETLIQELDRWLGSSPDYRWNNVRTELSNLAPRSNPREETKLILDLEDDIELKRLPWSNWEVLSSYYASTEIAIRAYKNPDRWHSFSQPKCSRIRILVALGGDANIDQSKALDFLKRLEEPYPGLIEATVLLVPESGTNLQDLERSLKRSLKLRSLKLELLSPQSLQSSLGDAPGHHIFIFIGHSDSHENGLDGHLDLTLSPGSKLRIADFKNTLGRAVERGLKLAIFNSCNGLGLATQLARLDLPQCIVMKEPIYNQAAIDFLNQFFTEFALNHRSLLNSVHAAKGTLEHFNGQYPGVTNLPTVCLKANAEPLTWKAWIDSLPWWQKLFVHRWRRNPVFKGLIIFLILLLLLAVVLLASFLLSPVVEKQPIPPITPSPVPDINSLIQKLNQPQLPQDVIELNNQIANQKPPESKRRIALIVPDDEPSADETRRGVAQAQIEFNCPEFKNSKAVQCKGTNGKFLEVVSVPYSKANNTDRAKELARNGILGIVVRATSSELPEIAAKYEPEKLVLVSTTSNATRDSMRLYSNYTFRVIPDVQSVAQSLISKFPSSKIGIIGSVSIGPSAYVYSLVEAVGNKANGQAVSLNSNGECILGDNRFNAGQCVNHIRGQSDVVLLVPNRNPVGSQNRNEIQDALSLIKEIKTNNLQITIVGSDTLYDQKLLTGDAGEISQALGVMVMVPWARSQDGQTPFEIGAQKRWGAGLINWRTAMAYDATQVIIQGLSQAQAQTSQALQKTLSQPGFKVPAVSTATGEITFGDGGSVPKGDRVPKPELELFVKVVKLGEGYTFEKQTR